MNRDTSPGVPVTLGIVLWLPLGISFLQVAIRALGSASVEFGLVSDAMGRIYHPSCLGKSARFKQIVRHVAGIVSEGCNYPSQK